MIDLREAGRILDTLCHGKKGFDGTADEALVDISQQAGIVGGGSGVYTEDEVEAGDVWLDADDNERDVEAEYHAKGWAEANKLMDRVLDQEAIPDDTVP